MAYGDTCHRSGQLSPWPTFRAANQGRGLYISRNEIAQITEIIGEEAMDTLLSLRGGSRMSVPAKMTDGHWLAEAIGFDEARALSMHLTSGRSSKAAQQIAQHSRPGSCAHEARLQR